MVCDLVYVCCRYRSKTLGGRPKKSSAFFSRYRERTSLQGDREWGEAKNKWGKPKNRGGVKKTLPKYGASINACILLI